MEKKSTTKHRRASTTLTVPADLPRLPSNSEKRMSVNESSKPKVYTLKPKL